MCVCNMYGCMYVRMYVRSYVCMYLRMNVMVYIQYMYEARFELKRLNTFNDCF